MFACMCTYHKYTDMFDSALFNFSVCFLYILYYLVYFNVTYWDTECFISFVKFL